MDAQQKERITGYFIEEANEHLVTIGDGLQDFAKTVNDPEAIQELYRAAHSIKGGAAMLGLGSLQKNALALEDYFKSLKSAPVAVDETLTGFFLQLFDPLKRLVKELETNLTLPPEREAEILSEINPVAEKLKQYLYQLREGGVSPADNAKEIPSLPDDFTAQVTRSLREMEIQFQQGDHPQQRSALTAQCQELATLGQSFSTWIELLETAKTAIANPNSDYSQLANVLISEIQQAQKHLLASQSDRIRASEQLKRLASAKATAKSVQNQSQIYSAPPAHSKEKEPIMGMEALNTLADLFENDGDLEYTWQEDETGDAVGQNQSSDNENWLAELADDTDFSDLLDEREESDSSASNGVSDEFANLFGELEEEDNRNQDNDLSETEESLSSENEDLSELFGEDFSFEEEEKNGRSVNVNENPKATKFDHFAEDLNALFSDDDVNTGDFFDQWQENQTSAKPQRKLTTPPSPSPQSSEGDVDDFLAISDSSKDESEEAFNLDNSEDEKAEIEWSLESLMDEADAETR
ncbi:MAG: Hpt domain-containing protein, partial [Chroococcales cyanobacterium]